MNRLKPLSFCVIFLASGLVGCSDSRPLSGREKGLIGGTAAGAGLGAIIGHATGSTGAGIAIGSGVGALAGGVLGNNSDVDDDRYKDEDERLRRQEDEIRRQRREIQELRGSSRDGSYDDSYDRDRNDRYKDKSDSYRY